MVDKIRVAGYYANIEMQDVIGAAYIKSYNHGSGSVRVALLFSNCDVPPDVYSLLQIRDLTWMNIKVVNAAYTVAVDQQWCGHNGCGGGNDPMAFYKCVYA